MKPLILLSSFAILTLSACEQGVGSLQPSMFEDTVVTPRKIELTQTHHVETIPTNELTHDRLMALTDHYIRNGESPLYMVFPYDPDVKTARLGAINRANITRGQLAKMDVHDAVVQTTPVMGAPKEVVIGYDKLTAQGPQNCGKMPGMNGTQTGSYGDYGLGCTVMDMTAKQIANPSDLEGVGGLGDKFDGGRAAAIVNRDVRAGAVNESVPGYILSEIGANN